MKTLTTILLMIGSIASAENFIPPSGSSVTPLSAGATFNDGAPGFFCYGFNSIVPSVKTDQAGTLYVEFSPDNSNWDSSLSFAVAAGSSEVHRITVTKKFCRVRFTNTASSAQTYFRLQTLLGDQIQLTSALNAVTSQDADASVVKAITEDTLIAEGKLQGYAPLLKLGTNSDVDAAEDICETADTYTGFDGTAAENVMAVSTSASDSAAGTGARTVQAVCIGSDFSQTTVSFTMNGTTPVDSGVPGWHCHTAFNLTAGSSGRNVGDISFYQKTTTSVVFLKMLAGRGQTNCSAYMVPLSKRLYVTGMELGIRGGSNTSVNGALAARPFGGAWRERQQISASNGPPSQRPLNGALSFTEKSQIMFKVNGLTGTNISVIGGYTGKVVDQ